ncbi:MULTISPECIES: flagellar biosynthetic protein FliO [Vibrio]|uniref:Flagellar protein n=1 Tax=Vibrio diazotrophicus TaxID=685 RepID=A0A2J8H8D6_VIBDI|nr:MULTISPECIES: flagellar biosynthetic protein FliO [Vibrio]MCF7361027.1 flagellar biosynthetic protein FliO [Vibrio sp. A1-b2]MCZ4371521.1 flagellar biosynthetic protein FliO [Vibrio diazotrophicus]PNH94514.1 flagellar biosynthetic protein FliO [Vibrio diazotrophicus]PNH97078.1 flagellar biosynthetic protein FliO [Vibrio diazotrophicus]PNI03043.1 flagellar biosynthetic protein FliO [Vibrio diazotrophicus]
MRKFIVLSLVASPALAAQSDQFDIATTLGSLLFVIAIIIGMAWLLKRMRVPAFGQQKGLSVVRQLPIGTKERLMIVQAGEEQFLIGVTSQSVQLISKLETPLTQEELESVPFSNTLTQLLKKNDKNTPV